MRHIHSFSLTLLAIFVMMGLNARAGDGKVKRVKEHVPNSYIVVLRDGYDADLVGKEHVKLHGGKLTSVSSLIGHYAITLPNDKLAEQISLDPRVAVVEENAVL